MSRADNVTVEPRMDDLLASIRRAIHEEGLDLSQTGNSGSLVRLPAGQSADRASVGGPRALARGAAERSQEVEDSEIVTLRNKISRELSRENPAPVLSVVSVRRPQPSQAALQGPPVFKSLLGGEEPNRPGPKPIAAVKPERSAAADKSAALPNATRHPVPASPVRQVYEPASRPGPAFRPPFGQSSNGIRRFQAHLDAPNTDGMISPETSNVTAGSFGRLAEQMFGREGGARSIDDLARELLLPMLKQWLDENLPQIVEQLVREEIERVARRGRR